MRTTNRRLLVALVVVLVGALIWAAIAALRPLPERTLTMATGPDGSAYRIYGERYRALLAKQGVDVRLVTTTGAQDNLARLRDAKSGVNAGFVQGGTTTEAQSPGLVSLGTMFYEPMWIFCRTDESPLHFKDVFGRRVSMGPRGSATRELALRLLKMNGVDPGHMQFLEYSPERAADELRGGRIDVAFIDTAWDSPAVRALLADPNVSVEDFPRADAYVALLPFLSKVVLPMGVANLAENRPPTDVTLIAPKASLVVREDLHPALQYLLIDAAMKIHGGPGVFNRAGEFPAAEMIDLPLSSEANHMYRSGPSFLRRHLPFWLAELAQRLLILAIPIAGLIYPVTRLVPEAWRWEMSRRLRRTYRELLQLEQALRRVAAGPERTELLRKLDALEVRAASLRMPDSFAAPAYELKQNIRFVQDKYAR
ncbi:MAG: TAXI family TRAP transporter solute-binding subunit [Steroidobacteraceae bacterium]